MDIRSGVFIYLKLRGAIRMDNMGEISPHPNPKGFVLEGESLLNISKKASRGQCLPFTDLSEVNRKDQLLGHEAAIPAQPDTGIPQVTMETVVRS